MIKILERYIAKTIVLATLLTALIITSILFLILILGELKNIGVGDYGIFQAMFYVFLRLPNELYHFSPMLILLGSMMGLNAISSHRELAVMRASGFAIRRIIYSVLGAGLALILVMSMIGEIIAPSLGYKAEVHKENAQNAGQAVITATGVWFHVENNFIHVQRVVEHQLLEGVTRYQFDDDHHLQATYFAKTLSYQNHQWKMNDVVKTSFYNDRSKSEFFPQSAWDKCLNKMKCCFIIFHNLLSFGRN